MRILVERDKTKLSGLLKKYKEIKFEEREEGYELKFKNKDILDISEINIYNYVKANMKIKKILRFSKKFVDVHKVGNTSKFKEALKVLLPKINPIYIKQNKCWWVGVEDIDEMNIEAMTKEIYKVGLCIGIIPQDLCM